MTKTYLPKVTEIKRDWYEIDASKLTLGRLASKIAGLLRGKHKPVFTSHMDLGDYVVVVNSAKVKVTGRKLVQKQYFRFSGYPGGITAKSLGDLLASHPEKVIRMAVAGMLAKNRLRKPILNRLKIVGDEKHRFKIDRKI